MQTHPTISDGPTKPWMIIPVQTNSLRILLRLNASHGFAKYISMILSRCSLNKHRSFYTNVRDYLIGYGNVC